MSAEIYIRQVEKSNLNGAEAAETLEEGDMVTLQAGGSVAKADPAAGDDVDGIIPHRMRGPQLREHSQDYSPVEYEAGEGPVPFYQLEPGAELTENAAYAGEEIEMFEDVALDGDLNVVSADSAGAETDAIGKALRYAAGEGDPCPVRLEL